MKKPKCPWKPPFRLWGMNTRLSEGVTDAKEETVCFYGDHAKAEAACYALNLAYPVKNRRKP